MTSPRRRRQRPAGSEPDVAHPTSGPRRRRSQAAAACEGQGIPASQEPPCSGASSPRINSTAELLFEDEDRLRRTQVIAQRLRKKFGNEGAIEEAHRRMRLAQQRVDPKRQSMVQQLKAAGDDDELFERIFSRAIADSEEDVGEILLWSFVLIVLRVHAPGSAMVS
jgi:hypothetical protein